jgi:uncharacterized protein YjbI with pentapeptide repeats
MGLQYDRFIKGKNYEARVSYIIKIFEADGRLTHFIKVIINHKSNSPFLEPVKTEFKKVIEDDSYTTQNFCELGLQGYGQSSQEGNYRGSQVSDKVLEVIIREDMTPNQLNQIAHLINKINYHRTILRYQQKGSIHLFFEGSEEDLQRLIDLQKSGKLSTLLNKHKSEDIPQVTVTKAEFSNDPQVIAKARLIRMIREEALDKKSLQRVDLIGTNLREADLSKADLSKADLSKANLREACLFMANLSEANLSEANLSGAYLSGAYLDGAYLSEANLSEANLSGAYLDGANLSEANLSEANLSGANLSEANLSEANLSGANLSGANLSGADMSEADLNNAIVKQAVFTDAIGISPQQKNSLIARGAIFNDTPNDHIRGSKMGLFG